MSVGGETGESMRGEVGKARVRVDVGMRRK